MAAEKYILISNDRIGTHIGDMGIPLDYSDISNVRAIIEISDSEKGKTPIRWSVRIFIRC